MGHEGSGFHRVYEICEKETTDSEFTVWNFATDTIIWLIDFYLDVYILHWTFSVSQGSNQLISIVDIQ